MTDREKTAIAAEGVKEHIDREDARYEENYIDGNGADLGDLLNLMSVHPEFESAVIGIKAHNPDIATDTYGHHNTKLRVADLEEYRTKIEQIRNNAVGTPIENIVDVVHKAVNSVNVGDYENETF